MFDEILKRFRIDGAANYAAGQVTIDRERWKETDVFSLLCRHFGDNRKAFFPPSVSPFAKLRVDSRFVDKNKLITSPFRELDKPVLPENRITFLGFLLELSVSQ